MSAFSHVQTDILTGVFATFATTQPEAYRAFVAALQEADRQAADRVVGEDHPEAVLRAQGAARQLRAMLTLAISPYASTRHEARASANVSPQL